MRLTLVRHAESTWNAEGRWQGQLDPPLSPRGQLQARAVSARLFERRFSHRYTSDLTRTRQTSEAIAEGARPDRRFREVDVGAWGGLLRQEVLERFGEQVAELRAGADIRIGGGESMREFEARVDTSLDALRAAHEPDEDVLLVTHGGVVRALASRLLGFRGRRGPLDGAENTSLTKLDWTDPSRPRLSAFNDAAHLPDASLAADVVLIATEPGAEPPRSTVDRLLSELRVPTFLAVGGTADGPLAAALGAEATARAAGALLAEAVEEPRALLIPVGAVPEAVTAALGAPSSEGLAPPGGGTVVQLRRRSDGGLALRSYGVEVG